MSKINRIFPNIQFANVTCLITSLASWNCILIIFPYIYHFDLKCNKVDVNDVNSNIYSNRDGYDYLGNCGGSTKVFAGGLGNEIWYVYSLKHMQPNCRIDCTTNIIFLHRVYIRKCIVDASFENRGLGGIKFCTYIPSYMS